mgnify:CR=1 FL=1
MNVLRRRRSDELRRDVQRRVSNSVTLSALSHKATPQSLSRTKSRSERLPRTRHRLGDMEEGHRGIVWPVRTPCGGSSPPGLAVPVARGGTKQLGERGSGDRTDDGEDIPFVLGVPQVSARPRDRRCGLRTWADLAPSSLRRSSSYSPRSAGAACPSCSLSSFSGGTISSTLLGINRDRPVRRLCPVWLEIT